MKEREKRKLFLTRLIIDLFVFVILLLLVLIVIFFILFLILVVLIPEAGLVSASRVVFS